MDKAILSELSIMYNKNFAKFSLIPEGFFQMSYLLETEDSEKFFIKVIDFSKHIIDKESFAHKVRHLHKLSSSLEFIPRILKTNTGQLYYLKDNKSYLVQEYIEGDLVGEEQTLEIIKQLNRLHSFPVVQDFTIAEKFNTKVIKRRLQIIKDFFKKEDWFREIVGGNYLELLDTRALRYKELQESINKENLCYVHKDPLGNAIKTKEGIYIIDWDDLTISNKEADLWPLVIHKKHLEFYENNSGKPVNKCHCEYYALESFFLYYEAYIQRYYLKNSDIVLQEVKKGIEDGILGWFESVYEEFSKK
jgi:hypothetical protein